MSKSGAVKDYKYGPKNNWRRTVWNDVLRRTHGLHKHYPVLYLAGPQDLDREVAIAKGVPRENLIAIDKHRPNVDAVRASGNLAIQADAYAVLRSWPMTRPVAAVLLDFCCGFDVKAMGVDATSVLMRMPFRGAPVMLNLMRGRDQVSNEFRKYLGMEGWFLKMLLGHPSVTFIGNLSRDEKSRAVSYTGLQALTISIKTLEAFGVPETKWMGLMSQAINGLLALMKPTYVSYHSGAVVFDSLVYNPFHLGNLSSSEELEIDKLSGKCTAVSRRIAATLAIRTTRMAQA